MTAPRPSSAPHRPAPRVPRVLVLGLLTALTLLVFLTVTWSSLRTRPTGIASLDLVVFADDDGPGVGYVVDFESERAGYPVVLHVDADGFPSLLFPAGGLARVEAGRRFRLPDPEGHAIWWSAPGASATVLTVLAENPPADVDRLVELVERAAARADDPGRALRNVESVLRDRLGEPVVRTLRPAEHG